MEPASPPAAEADLGVAGDGENGEALDVVADPPPRPAAPAPGVAGGTTRLDDRYWRLPKTSGEREGARVAAVAGAPPAPGVRGEAPALFDPAPVCVVEVAEVDAALPLLMEMPLM